ncbi:MAG: hypothetical protein Q7T30_04260 [Planctomycetota bacterium]|nr:hypothetical protein [Planctomycetota bacterium]
MRPFLLRCVSLCLLAGCAARPYPAYAIENDAEMISNVVVSDGSLQSVVRVGKALVARTASGELRVVVPVRNIDDEPIQVLAQISFQDAQRQPIGDTTNRQVAIIPAGGTVDMEWISRSQQAADYVLRLGWNN